MGSNAHRRPPVAGRGDLFRPVGARDDPSGKEIGGRWGPARTITVLVTATLAILIPTTVITVAETVVDGWHH
jgi:hypothetical protein